MTKSYEYDVEDLHSVMTDIRNDVRQIESSLTDIRYKEGGNVFLSLEPLATIQLIQAFLMLLVLWRVW